MSSTSDQTSSDETNGNTMVENSPLTLDVHRALTGAAYMNLPEPQEDETTPTSNVEPRILTPGSGSSDTDSLSQRVATLLNRSSDYREDNRTPVAMRPDVTFVDTDLHTGKFNSGSFVTSSRFAQSLTTSPSKNFSSGGTTFYSFTSEDFVAPPAEFADSLPGSATKTQPNTATATSQALQTLLKSLEWDHAWDVSAPTV